MKFFSPKPKKGRILKVWKNKQKNLSKVVCYDVFSIFISTDLRYRSPSFLYNVLDRKELLEHFPAIFGTLNDIFV